MVKEFNYTSHNIDRDRKIFVTREDDNYISGIDLEAVGTVAANAICKRYNKFVPTSDPANELAFIKKLNKEWMRGYRKFSKDKINGCFF